MIKTLYLLRHAKSPKDISVPGDIDRPLNERGYADIQLISKQLVAGKVKVDLIISSPAIRAFSTAVVAARAIQYDPGRIQLNLKLFEASTDDFMDVIAETDDGVQSLLVTGHNPSISNVFSVLSKKRVEMPTGAIAALNFELKSWTDIRKIKPKLLFYIFPSQFKSL